jgi:hypothetical protein
LAPNTPTHIYRPSADTQAVNSLSQGVPERTDDMIEPRVLFDDGEEPVGVGLVPHCREFVVDAAQEGGDPVQCG